MEKKNGSLMVLSDGIAWGISGVSAFKQKKRFMTVVSSSKTLLSILVFCICALLLNQYSYLNAIRYTNAGTATVLQYLNPIIILLVISIKERRRPTFTECLAMFLAIMGTLVIPTHTDLSQLAITPVGLFWGLLAALTAALYIIIPAKLVAEWGSLIIIGLAMMMGGVIFPIMTQAWQYQLPLTGHNLLAL